MKKIIATLFVFVLCSVSAVMNAKDYKGLLTVYIFGQAQQSEEISVTVTENSGTAELKINDFSIAGYLAMKVTMNATHAADGKLTTPATVTVNLPMSLLLGKLTVINSELGTLTSDACALDMQLKAANRPVDEEIRIVFNGTAQ